MEWLQTNWIWIALGLGFVAMHLFGHGGHGGHGRHGHGRHGGGGDSKRDPNPKEATPAPGVGEPNDSQP